jgi:hypothetical protein
MRFFILISTYLFMAFVFSPKARAGLVDLNLLYYSDSQTATTSSSGSKLFYDVFLGFGVYNKNGIVIGWNYANYSNTSTSSATTTTYTSTQMGPKFIFFLNKDHNWRLGLAYNLLTSATYQVSGSPSETWKGTAYAIDIGYQFALSDDLLFGTRINYSISNFTEKLIGTAYSTVSNSQTFIYPSLAISYFGNTTNFACNINDL